MNMMKNGAVREIEILEFKSGGYSYGTDINEIREILPYNKKPTPIPNSHSSIEGIIKPRDFIIPIVDIMSLLKLSDIEEEKQEMLIVTGLNQANVAFHVDCVKGIHKVIENEIEEPGEILSTSQSYAVYGVISLEDRKIEMLDFRKMIGELTT